MNTIKQVEQLRQAGRNVAYPFMLNVDSQHDMLVAQQSLRILPGKRLTVLAQWGSRRVVVKLFYHPKRWYKYGERDANGVKALMAKDIKTPKLLYHGKCSIDGVYIVILEYLADTVSVANYLQQDSSSSEPMAVINNIITGIAHLHNVGLMQLDLHLDNFLLKNKILYTIDGSDIISYKSSLKVKKSLINLALLFAHLPITIDQHIARLIESYCEVRAWQCDDKIIHLAMKHIKRARKKHRRDRMHKIFRNCTEFVARTNRHIRFVCVRDAYTPYMKQAIENLDSLFNDSKTRVLKAGNTCTIIMTHINNQAVVIKRYNIKNFRHALERGLQRTRAERSWRNAHLLMNLGIATARPIALIEKRFCWFWRKEAYLITEFLVGQELLDSMIDDQQTITADRVIKMLNHLRQAKLSHGDMKATNIILSDNKINLIDLDSMQCHNDTISWARAWEVDIIRFLKNWEDDDEIYQLFSQKLSKEGIK